MVTSSPKKTFFAFVLLIGLVLLIPSTSFASPKTKAKRDLKRIVKLERRISKLIAKGKITPVELADLSVANRLTDSDGDGIPDIVESAKGNLDACVVDSDGDGKDDGDDDDNGASSSSSSGGSSSSSSGGSSSSSSGNSSSSSSGSSSSSSSGTSGGGSSSSSSGDDD